MPNPALYKFRKIYSTPYVQNQQIPIELTKYMQTDFIRRLIVQVTGSVTTGTGGAGAATGRTNPEDLLISAILQSSPTVANIIPINAVSGRGLFLDNAVNRKRFMKAAPIVDNQAGAQTVNICYELLFRRNGIRKSVEYGFDISRYTGALLLLTFGDQTRLVTGSSNSWPLNSSLTISIWVDSDLNVAPDQIHGHEIFEQNFPILQTQPDFLINQLPAGFIYTDLMFITEQNNIPTQGILTNIDIEGGGRVWAQLGDNNADVLQRVLTEDNFDGSVPLDDDPRIATWYNNNAAHTVFVAPTSAGSPTVALPDPFSLLDGIYVIKMRDGMFTRNIDALTAQIIIKLGVTFISGTQNVRLIGRRMVPGSVYKKAPAATKR